MEFRRCDACRRPSIFNRVFACLDSGAFEDAIRTDDLASPHGHKLPIGYGVASTPVLGGLPHKCRLESEAAPRRSGFCAEGVDARTELSEAEVVKGSEFERRVRKLARSR